MPHRVLIVLLTALFSALLTSQAAATPDPRRTGPDAGPRAESFLAPDTSTSLRCGPWDLTGLTAGPGCELTLNFVPAGGGGSGTKQVRVQVMADDGGHDRLVLTTGAGGSEPDPVIACVRTRLLENDAERGLPTLCEAAPPTPPAPPAEGATGAVDPEPSGPSSRSCWGSSAS